jgi:predicted permease
MTLSIFYKLLALIAVVGLGWLAGRLRWLARAQDADPARVLGNVAFYIFVPALLFRTMARLDLTHMPWRGLAAFFVPVLAVLFACYASQRRAIAARGPAAPSVRAIAVVFGNSVQLGIPFITAILGEAGLAALLPLISLHALVLLSVLTALVELDLARAHARKAGAPSLAHTLALTARNTLIHPVVLPVSVGLVWALAGWPLHPVLDEALVIAGGGVVPVCLVLTGASLAAYGLRGLRDHWRAGAWISVAKLLLLPAVVLVVARWGFGLSGVALSVAVLTAAMPTGANAMIFAQRYDALQAEVSAATVFSTVAFMLSAPLWLAALAFVNRL